MKTIHRCVYMKTNVVYEEIGTFIGWYGTSPDLPVVIEILLCLSTPSASLHSWKDIKFISLVEDPPVFHINVWKNLLFIKFFIHLKISFWEIYPVTCTLELFGSSFCSVVDCCSSGPFVFKSLKNSYKVLISIFLIVVFSYVHLIFSRNVWDYLLRYYLNHLKKFYSKFYTFHP